MIWLYIGRIEVEGAENVPMGGPLIVASNHLNNADPPVIAASLPRHPIFMAKRELFRFPPLGLAFKAWGVIPVRRDQADLSALRQAVKVLDDEQMLVIFPEGTRSRTATLGQAYPGPAIIAARSGAPVLPVAITGTEKLRWPHFFFRPLIGRPRVRIAIGRPFFLPKPRRLDEKTAIESTSIIMRRIAELLPPSYRGSYDSTEVEGHGS